MPDSCQQHGPGGAWACSRCARKRKGAALGGVLGLVVWAATVAGTWLVARYQAEWRAFAEEGPSLALVVEMVREELGRLPGVLASAEYGYQFAMLTAYVWLGSGAVAGHAIASGGWRRLRLRSQLAAVLVVGLMFGSVRWLLAEVGRVDRIGMRDGRFYFERGVAWGPMLAMAVVALVLLLRAGRRRRGASGPRREMGASRGPDALPGGPRHDNVTS